MKYGYGYKPKANNTGHHWYAVAFDKRSEAHKECREELSWISNQLYTQGHVTFFGFNFKVPFTRRAVEWSKEDAAKGIMVGHIHDPLTCAKCRKLLEDHSSGKQLMQSYLKGT